MARQDLRIAVSETNGKCLDAVAVAEIAHITQQVYRYLGILDTDTHKHLVFKATCAE